MKSKPLHTHFSTEDLSKVDIPEDFESIPAYVEDTFKAAVLEARDLARRGDSSIRVRRIHSGLGVFTANQQSFAEAELTRFYNREQDESWLSQRKFERVIEKATEEMVEAFRNVEYAYQESSEGPLQAYNDAFDEDLNDGRGEYC